MGAGKGSRVFLTDIIDWFLGLVDRGCGTLLVGFVALSLVVVVLQGAVFGLAYLLTGGHVTDNLEAIPVTDRSDEEFAHKLEGSWSDKHGNEIRLTFAGRGPASSAGSPVMVKLETTRGRVFNLVRSGHIVGITPSREGGSVLRAEASGIETVRNTLQEGDPVRWNGAQISLSRDTLTLTSQGGIAFNDRVLLDPVTVTFSRKR